MKDFANTYPHAIESGTWIKSGTCYVSTMKDKHNAHIWYFGFIELERQGVECDTESGIITITYSTNISQTLPNIKSAKHNNKIVYNLSEIRCVYCDNFERGVDFSGVNYLVIVTSDGEVVKLKFRAEAELEDWLATINISCGNLRGISGRTAASDATLFGLTFRGFKIRIEIRL